MPPTTPATPAPATTTKIVTTEDLTRDQRIRLEALYVTATLFQNQNRPPEDLVAGATKLVPFITGTGAP